MKEHFSPLRVVALYAIFGAAWVLFSDTALHALVQDGEQPVHVSNKAFQVPRLLVSNPNRLLTKDNILEGVWGEICVCEGLTKEYVHDLRLALGDDPKKPKFIETVPARERSYFCLPRGSNQLRGRE